MSRRQALFFHDRLARAPVTYILAKIRAASDVTHFQKVIGIYNRNPNNGVINKICTCYSKISICESPSVKNKEGKPGFARRFGAGRFST